METGESFKREGIYVYLWLIHVEVWQKTAKFCKSIILQQKNKLIKKEKKFPVLMEITFQLRDGEVTISKIIIKIYNILDDDKYCGKIMQRNMVLVWALKTQIQSSDINTLCNKLWDHSSASTGAHVISTTQYLIPQNSPMRLKLIFYSKVLRAFPDDAFKV